MARALASTEVARAARSNIRRGAFTGMRRGYIQYAQPRMANQGEKRIRASRLMALGNLREMRRIGPLHCELKRQVVAGRKGWMAAMVWRIFSKLWPPRETPPPQAAGEDQAEHRVAAHWMSVLRQAWHALYKENVANRDLASRLCALKDAQLIELDPAIRGRYRDDTSWGRGQAIEVVSVTPHSSIDAEREAQWFVAACDADGFVRERALQAFLECPGKLALPVALIRCDDWVDAVRAAALRLLRHVLEIGEAGPFAHLDMLLLLRRRQRFAQETWSALLEPFLLDGSRGQARWDATRSKSSRVRLLAYSLIQRAEPQRLHGACLQALEDPDPLVARWGLATGSENADLAQLTELVQRGSTHPRASLRTQALRLRAALGLPGTREAMQAALFDVSRTARGAAVHFLRNDASVDPVQLWRDAVSAGDSKRTRVALDALAPVAKQ